MGEAQAFHTIAVPEFGGRSLLRSAVVYGANASGKSNLIAAAQFVDEFVNTSMERKLSSPIEVTPFLLVAEPVAAPVEFELTFIDSQNVRYQYGFHVTTRQVVREWLVAYPKGLPQTWFEREHLEGSEPEWYFGRNLKGKNSQVAELTRPDVLFLSNAAKLNHRQLGGVFEWFQKGLRVMSVDELSPSLYIVELFHNPQINPKGAQLIFNTHDTTLMDGSLFRRDQIWFVEKDRQGCSHLYPLLDYSPRKDEALAKGYLLGRYGAIPFLSEPQWGEPQRAEA